MDLRLNSSLVKGYKSERQKIRIMSEDWAARNMFCPCCGNHHINKLENNSPVADMKCEICGEIFELKAKRGSVGNKIPDGAYTTMIDRITSSSNPDLLLMQYKDSYLVENFIIIPKFFFVPRIIEKRNPLAPEARRAVWVGCNILVSHIPEQGKIDVIKNSVVKNVEDVVSEYMHIKELHTKNIEARGWLMDVLNCVNNIQSDIFSLSEVYNYVELLKKKYTTNNNIKAKIRQQLQLLRDKGFIDFLGNGKYKKRNGIHYE